MSPTIPEEIFTFLPLAVDLRLGHFFLKIFITVPKLYSMEYNSAGY